MRLFESSWPGLVALVALGAAVSACTVVKEEGPPASSPAAAAAPAPAAPAPAAPATEPAPQPASQPPAPAEVKPSDTSGAAATGDKPTGETTGAAKPAATSVNPRGACPELAPPDATFCPRGRPVEKRDAKGCAVDWDCVMKNP